MFLCMKVVDTFWVSANPPEDRLLSLPLDMGRLMSEPVNCGCLWRRSAETLDSLHGLVSSNG